MTNPYVILGLILAWLASCAGVGYWQHQAGVTVTTEKYERRDNIELTKANDRITELEQQYRAEEQAHAAALSLIAANYEKEKQDANAKTAALIAAARAGALRLYGHQTTGVPATGSQTAPTAPAAGGCDGAGNRGFSAGDSEFLLALGGRANAVRDKLTTCQSIVRADRAP